MKHTLAPRKTAVQCDDCQTIFTAEIEDGEVFLLGVGEQCGCGGTEFRSFA